jgi:DNA-binding NtrC family response regulator
MSVPAIELAPEAVEALRRYSWPGNVRELKNVIERAILLSDRKRVVVKDLRFEVEGPASTGGVDFGADMTLDELEKRYVEHVLREEGGRVDAASRRLGIPRSSLYQKIKRWDIPISRS